MNGGHFLTVSCSSCSAALTLFCGSSLNQSGSPSTAAIGRGRIGSNSGGQRNVMERPSVASMFTRLTCSAIVAGWRQYYDKSVINWRIDSEIGNFDIV